MNAAQLAKRVSQGLNRIAGMNNPLYLRTYLPDPGGDALTGRDTGTVTDTAISPPPAYQRIGARDLMYFTAAGKKVSPDDFTITLAANSITEETVRDPNTQFVIKAGTEDEEVLRVIHIDSKGFQGTTVAWLLVARSVSAT